MKADSHLGPFINLLKRKWCQKIIAGFTHFCFTLDPILWLWTHSCFNLCEIHGSAGSACLKGYAMCRHIAQSVLTIYKGWEMWSCAKSSLCACEDKKSGFFAIQNTSPYPSNFQQRDRAFSHMPGPSDAALDLAWSYSRGAACHWGLFQHVLSRILQKDWTSIFP